jgi:uncharacterized protein (TIGR02145 family)
MPSTEQYKELINSSYTTTEWITLNGVYGSKITSKKNGNSVFLPAAGYRDGSSLNGTGSYGHYWSSSPNESGNGARNLTFHSSNIGPQSNDFRSYAYSVRCVKNSPSSKTLTLHAN